MKRLLPLLLALLPGLAFAQGVVGPPAAVPPVTTGNCVKWINLTTIADSGGPCGGTGAPGGTTTQVQFNNAGTFGGITNGSAGTCLVSNGVSTTPSFASCTGVAPSFGSLTGGSNTIAAMIIGTGASLSTTGSGTNTATAVPVTGVTGMGTGVGTFLITPSSANLAAAVTGATGTGALVFGTSPVLATPTLGVATATSINNTTIPPSAGTTPGSTGAFTTNDCVKIGSTAPLQIQDTGSPCGAGGGAVSSVSAGGSGSVTVTPTTGAVVVDLASQSAGTMCANLTGSAGVPTCNNSMTGLQTALTTANAQIVTATVPTGPTNDYTPAGFGTTTAVLYLTPTSGGSTLNGLLAGSAMQQVFLVNAEAAGGADAILLINQSASDTTAANRFFAAGNLVLPPGGGVDCIYLASTITRWWCH